jgi:hypothetical protein
VTAFMDDEDKKDIVKESRHIIPKNMSIGEQMM